MLGRTISLVLCFLPVLALAGEQVGPVHPIVEPDMLEEIYRVLKEKEKSGELAKLQEEAVERSKRSIETPKPVEGLEKVKKANHFYWDPSVTAPQTIKDPEGRTIVEAGTVVNPLDYVNMSKHLLFIDGNDPDQVKKAYTINEQHKGMVKVIMTAGKPLQLSREWKTQIYFDQGGSLVRKLGIKKVPSLVSQEGKRLRIDELE